jgi:PAS domain S-box-containing protein
LSRSPTRPISPETGDEALRVRLDALPDPISLLQGMFAYSPVPYIVFEADGHPLLNNPAYREMFGAEPPPEYNLFDDEEMVRIGLVDSVRAAFAGETLQTPTFWYDPKALRHISVTHAKRVAISATFFPLHRTGDQVTHIAIAFKDVTAELEAQERAEAERDRLKTVIEEKDRLATALNLSEERLRETLEAADVGTWEWNISENRVDWSPNVERLHGLSTGSFGGTYEAWMALVHPEDREPIGRKVSDAIRQKKPYVAELRVLRPDGTIGRHLTRGHVVMDEQGEPRLLRGLVLDETARHAAQAAAREALAALEASEARFRHLADVIPQQVWTSNPNGTLDFINQRVADYFDRSREQLLREGWRAVVHPADLPLFSECWVHSLATGDEYEAEFRLRRPDGSYRWHLARAVALRGPHGVIEKWFGTNTDIDERKKTLEELQRRAEFERHAVGIVSHDLRNPISAIGISASSLLRSGQLDEQQVKRVKRIVASTDRANRMIRDFLDFTQARLGGGIPVTPLIADLHEVVQTAVDEVRLSHPERNICFRCEETGAGTFDPDRIAQVVGNLVANACQHSPRDAAIYVLSSGIKDELLIRVSNSGSLIPPEVIPTLFLPFKSGGTAPRRAAGSIGLGLYIAQQLVLAHHGAIEVSSTAQEGTAFTVRLPR